ncbi:hypothetical protein Tco_1156866, partial [Tanacetum coccineum]
MHPFYNIQKNSDVGGEFIWTNKAEEALQKIKRKLNKLQVLVMPKEGEPLMICLQQGSETISYALFVERGGVQVKQQTLGKITPTPRAWRLYFSREANKEGSGVGMILVSPEEITYSYVICPNFSALDDNMNYEALLAGLFASASK